MQGRALLSAHHDGGEGQTDEHAQRHWMTDIPNSGNERRKATHAHHDGGER